MPTLALRAIRIALAAAFLLSIGDVVLAQPTAVPSMAEDQRMLPYVRPGQLVNIVAGVLTCIARAPAARRSF